MSHRNTRMWQGTHAPVVEFPQRGPPLVLGQPQQAAAGAAAAAAARQQAAAF